MINISLKINCKELVKGLLEGEYELPDGATVGDAWQTAQRESGVALPDSVKNSVAFLLNSRSADFDSHLGDGDKIRILQKIMGG